jgi:hypothetical protein
MTTDWQELTRLTGGQPLVIERVRLENSKIAVEGRFALPALARLPQEDQIFAAAFLQCHGSIKQMEQIFAVSYPTIKNRLNRINARLGLVEIKITEGGGDILERLDRGEINAKEAIELMKNKEKK